MQRGSEFSIMLGANELMNSRLSGSEVALATHACCAICACSGPKLLIGGLGMGFTLRAALSNLGPDARIIVAELVPAVVAWARGPLVHIFGNCLDDPRVDIVEGDVGALIRSGETFDAILLDVDNGPAGLTRDTNDALYSAHGLTVARKALRRGGVLAVWSVEPNEPFANRMRRAGFVVEERRVRANAGKRGARHVIWIAQRD